MQTYRETCSLNLPKFFFPDISIRRGIKAQKDSFHKALNDMRHYVVVLSTYVINTMRMCSCLMLTPPN